MATKFVKLSTSIVTSIIIGVISFIAGVETKAFWKDPCDGCCTECETKLKRAYVIPTTSPTEPAINLKDAKELIKRYSKSKFAVKNTFLGMNLHLNHLEQMIRFHIELKSTSPPTAHGGFRIYNGLKDHDPGTDPTEDHIIQLIFPLSDKGAVLTGSDIYTFGAFKDFELPCPDLCDGLVLDL